MAQPSAPASNSNPCVNPDDSRFLLILPNEVRIFLELRKPNTEKVGKFGMRNIYLAGSQTIIQIAIIFVIAYLTV